MHPRPRWTILEGGAGKGQLTIPLLRKLPTTTRYVAVDSSRGAYSRWLQELEVALKETGLLKRVQILNEDVKRMKSVKSQSVNAVVSNELLCDLPREPQLTTAFREFNRVLIPGSLMVHGEWSSVPQKNKTLFRVSHHPAWNPDKLHVMAKKEGFRDVEFYYFDMVMTFRGEAADKEVESWAPAKHFLLKNKKLLWKHGMRLPPEHLIVCRKPTE